jgi:hypothetical protein
LSFSGGSSTESLVAKRAAHAAPAAVVAAAATRRACVGHIVAGAVAGMPKRSFQHEDNHDLIMTSLREYWF